MKVQLSSLYCYFCAGATTLGTLIVTLSRLECVMLERCWNAERGNADGTMAAF